MHAAVNVQITSTLVHAPEIEARPSHHRLSSYLQIVAASCPLFAVLSSEAPSLSTTLQISIALKVLLPLLSLSGCQDRHSLTLSRRMSHSLSDPSQRIRRQRPLLTPPRHFLSSNRSASTFALAFLAIDPLLLFVSSPSPSQLTNTTTLSPSTMMYLRAMHQGCTSPSSTIGSSSPPSSSSSQTTTTSSRVSALRVVLCHGLVYLCCSEPSCPVDRQRYS